jgi:hypothetical protein
MKTLTNIFSNRHGDYGLLLTYLKATSFYVICVVYLTTVSQLYIV